MQGWEGCDFGAGWGAGNSLLAAQMSGLRQEQAGGWEAGIVSGLCLPLLPSWAAVCSSLFEEGVERKQESVWQKHRAPSWEVSQDVSPTCSVGRWEATLLQGLEPAWGFPKGRFHVHTAVNLQKLCSVLFRLELERTLLTTVKDKK